MSYAQHKYRDLFQKDKEFERSQIKWIVFSISRTLNPKSKQHGCMPKEGTPGVLWRVSCRVTEDSTSFPSFVKNPAETENLFPQNIDIKSCILCWNWIAKLSLNFLLAKSNMILFSLGENILIVQKQGQRFMVLCDFYLSLQVDIIMLKYYSVSHCVRDQNDDTQVYASAIAFVNYWAIKVFS